MIVYGIKNCNTVKSALDWLKKHKVTFDFHDYKTKGITSEKLHDWSNQVGWEQLVNKRGTTWRQLDEQTQRRTNNQKSAIALMLEKTSLIKRPLIEENGKVITLGFSEEEFAARFK